jgi:hypothetical protein
MKRLVHHSGCGSSSFSIRTGTTIMFTRQGLGLAKEGFGIAPVPAARRLLYSLRRLLTQHFFKWIFSQADLLYG